MPSCAGLVLQRLRCRPKCWRHVPRSRVRWASRSRSASVRKRSTSPADATADDGGRLRGRVQAVEALGPEQLVHVEIDAKPVLVEDVLEGVDDVDGDGELAELGIETDGSRATVVARLEASAIVRPDEPIELAVDLRHLHFFDLDSGEAIGV